MTDSLHTRLAVPHPRMAWLDILRGVALLAMSSYHFLWDLGDFGYIDPTYPASGWPKIYARCIASTFLFLAGFSLALAHSKTIRWRSFGVRLAKIAAAAAVVTTGSYFFMPQGLIFFGILHAIATMSVIGLIFLRAHLLVIVLAAVAALIAPQYLASEAFNQPWLWWLGLSTQIRISFDYVPLLPWLCPFLLGMVGIETLVALPPNADRSHQQAIQRPCTSFGIHRAPEPYLLSRAPARNDCRSFSVLDGGARPEDRSFGRLYPKLREKLHRNPRGSLLHSFLRMRAGTAIQPVDAGWRSQRHCFGCRC